MKTGLAILVAMLLSLATPVAATVGGPPRTHVAGFGHSIDEHMNVVYEAFAQTLDTGVVAVRFQCRPSGSAVAQDWTTMGLGVPVGDDSSLWSVEWQPCLLNGKYELRMVASDSSDEAPDLQPILHVSIDNCLLTPIEQSESFASAWFEDRRFNDMGLVNVEATTSGLDPKLVAVYEAQSGLLATETIQVWQPNPDTPEWYAGSFNPSPIQHGGVGRFWIAYNDYEHLTTHLSFAQLAVGRVTAHSDSHVANDQICAWIQSDAGALDDSTRLVLFPSRIPTLNIGSPVQIWPSCAPGDLLTVIRLTGPGGFRDGAYAQVQISYRSSIPDGCLTVERLDGPPIMKDPESTFGSIGGGIAVFQMPIRELEGTYAVVSRSHSCEQQAALPTSALLAQNYPNPFNTSTVIPFDLEKESDWTLEVFNIMGQSLRTFRGHDAAGGLRVTWDGLDRNGTTVPSGNYFYRITTPGWTASKKMTLLK